MFSIPSGHINKNYKKRFRVTKELSFASESLFFIYQEDLIASIGLILTALSAG